MTAKRTRGKQAAAPAHDINTASGLIAHEIVQQYGDLAPSVNKIMGAGLTEEGQLDGDRRLPRRALHAG